MANEINSKYPQTKAIAGVATGAIGIGMLVAEALDLPFMYVRPQPKKHGRKNQIEGQYDIDAPTVVVEDLISTGKSSLQAVDALRKANINVLGMLALFSYEFDVAEANMNEEAVELTALCGYNTLIETAVTAGYIESEQETILKEWRKTPALWSPK
jgi:orotate phosphoribosyltransferase|tara:strand:- start:251 stop:718 length:468 start_codon:yes stop_codon:yes gene_type:complete